MREYLKAEFIQNKRRFDTLVDIISESIAYNIGCREVKLYYPTFYKGGFILIKTEVKIDEMGNAQADCFYSISATGFSCFVPAEMDQMKLVKDAYSIPMWTSSKEYALDFFRNYNFNLWETD